MSDLASSIALARVDFADELRRRGFVSSGASHLTGRVATEARDYPVRVELGPDFPFGPPEVFPLDDFPTSWHLQPWSGMCLYHGDDLAGLPWLDVDEFLALIERWFTESMKGWSGDFPTLDLDVYVVRAEDERLIVHSDLSGSTWIEFNELGNKCLLAVSRRSRPKRRDQPRSNGQLCGYVVSIGEPKAPISEWKELAPLLGDKRKKIQRAIREHRIDLLLVRYSRAGNDGVLALKVRCDGDGVISIGSMQAASFDTKNLTLRAGPAADGLREKKVAVVGVGAVGSHLADSLARSGVGGLVLVDGDIVKPGNLIRHPAHAGHIGWSKADAMAQVIKGALYNQSEVTPVSAKMLLPGDAEFLLGNFDLVVDATADGKATALLHHAAQIAGKHIVSVCLKEDGKVVRLDILPPLSGPPLPATPESMRDPAEYVYEAGCGDPVSMTPHFAVLEAASIAARHAIGLLTGAPLHPAGEVRDYR